MEKKCKYERTINEIPLHNPKQIDMQLKTINKLKLFREKIYVNLLIFVMFTCINRKILQVSFLVFKNYLC